MGQTVPFSDNLCTFGFSFSVDISLGKTTRFWWFDSIRWWEYQVGSWYKAWSCLKGAVKLQIFDVVVDRAISVPDLSEPTMME
jgi:hypothetical protein